MDLIEHYNSLYTDSLLKIESDEVTTDENIVSSDDNRRGMTLILRPDLATKNQFQRFISDMKKIDPDQYYQPVSDIHITVLAIISCYKGFELNSICISDYVNLIEKSILSDPSFSMSFKGVTLSPSCVMIQGFNPDNQLNIVRDHLRTGFRDSEMQQSIDVRYAIRTAHSTIIRFRKPLANKKEYLETIKNYRQKDFGTFTVNSIELVCNDWYHRNKFVEILHKFELK